MQSLEREEIEKRILKLVADRCGISAAREEEKKITLNTDIRRELQFDSIMLVVLQIAIEDSFGIRLNPIEDDFQQIFTTVDAICDYVQRCLEE